MQPLPVAEPGQPDTRSPARLLVWVARQQLGTLSLGVAFGILWMVAQALMPFALGRAVQEGIVDDDTSALALWAGQSVGLVHDVRPAGELVRSISEEADSILRGLSSS